MVAADVEGDFFDDACRARTDPLPANMFDAETKFTYPSHNNTHNYLLKHTC